MRPSSSWCLPLLALASPAAAQSRAQVDASQPVDLAVTVYRDPGRGEGQAMNPDWPRGFAMISEVRTVTLPPGESTIRFEGVAEGMVAVSAIVTGLPGGTIEQNRNADLLSPGALVDGTLGNRVTITRTNPATGAATAQSAIVRTRADGGLVLETDEGFEAVRCSGLAEGLSFDRVPAGLSSEPVFSIDTRDANGGTYTVTLSYLAWGFDWEASYVARLHEGGDDEDLRFDLTSWLTILNDNGQTFENAQLLAVAGTLNVTSDFQSLSDPPDAAPLTITCYPIGSTATGSPYPYFPDAYDYAPYPPPPPPAPPPMAMETAMPITVTGARMMDTAVMASEEQLGALKLYRVPVRVDVNAQGMKQIAFLDRRDIEGRLVYESDCLPWNDGDPQPAGMLLETVNDEEHGLGRALPSGNMLVFESGPAGDLLVGEQGLRDYAVGQDVELAFGFSTQVFVGCQWQRDPDAIEPIYELNPMRATISNAGPQPVTVRLNLGYPSQWELRGVRTELHDGQRVVEVRVPGNTTREVTWQARSTDR